MDKFNQLHSKVKSKVINYKNNHIVQDGKVYSLEGEDISYMFDPDLKVKFKDTQFEQYESMNSLYEFEKENGGFLFLFYRINYEMELYNLNKSDIARLLYLSTFISYNDNKIVYDNGRHITDNALAAMLKLKDRQYKEYIKKLVTNNILILDNNNKYLNEHICKSGALNIKQLQKNNVQYIRLFKRTVRQLFELSNVRELNKLANVYMVLPYINLYTNIISYNPYEKDTDLIQPMTIKDLATKLGYVKVDAFRKIMYKTIIDNEYVFGFFLVDGAKNNMKVVVNPKIVYASNNENLNVIRVLFKPTK